MKHVARNLVLINYYLLTNIIMKFFVNWNYWIDLERQFQELPSAALDGPQKVVRIVGSVM